MATILYANGKTETVIPKNGKWFTLKEKQDIVGGHIEIIPSREGNWLVINEEGKLEGKPLNEQATLLYAYGFLFKDGRPFVHDVVVGDVLYCTEDELEQHHL